MPQTDSGRGGSRGPAVRRVATYRRDDLSVRVVNDHGNRATAGRRRGTLCASFVRPFEFGPRRGIRVIGVVNGVDAAVVSQLES